MGVDSISKGLNGKIFVMRFESVETPCLCIDSSDHSIARPRRTLINSNHRIRLLKDDNIDSGTSCLNQYCARYMKLNVDSVDASSMKLSGKVLFTYGYPAGNLIQLLGMANNSPDQEGNFLNSLLQNGGTFDIYPEFDKYRISIQMNKKGPYETGDKFIGYLEILSNPFTSPEQRLYCINFDRMSLVKGDQNNAISLKFTSTTFDLETDYYTRRLHDVLQFLASPDKRQSATAIWTYSFFSNPQCPGCKFIYDKAMSLNQTDSPSIPTTNPIPAH